MTEKTKPRTVEEHEAAYSGHKAVTGPLAHPDGRKKYLSRLGEDDEKPGRAWGYIFAAALLFWICLLMVGCKA